MQKTLKVLEKRLRKNLLNRDPKFWTSTCAALEKELQKRIANGDACEADQAWFLHEICKARSTMIEVFELLKSAKFKDAWILLEQIELSMHWTRRNPFFNPNDFLCGDLDKQVSEWQKLFPYKVFGSPEFRIKREECSICRQSQNPWSSCSHEKGKVYAGRLCSRIVRDMDFLGLALVLEPVQKYSVIIASGPNGEDTSDYSLVQAITERVKGPFSKWHAHWTTRRHPHKFFSHCDTDDACPCGSGRKYEACCLTEIGVLRPHLDVHFDELDAIHLKTTYIGYGANS